MKTTAILTLLALTGVAGAAPRTSANYSIPAEAAVSGGSRATSGSYTNDGSVGGVAGISTVAAPAQTAKAGYIAQLYETTGLTLTASPLTVNETATLQLGAWLALDDATFLTVPTASVAWSVTNGPLTINATGLATGGVVFQNTAATAQGIHLGYTGSLGLTVVNTLPDNFGTYAADSLEDAWQVQYFGLPPNASAGPLVDADADGFDNLFEYNAGLIPTDPLSVFNWWIEPVPGQPAQRRIIFSPRLAGRTYTVKTSPSLLGASWISLSGATTSDNGTVRTVTDPNATGARKFYRVDVSNP